MRSFHLLTSALFVPLLLAQDVTYLATQNFLIDLPYRNGSYANQLTTNVMTARSETDHEPPPVLPSLYMLLIFALSCV